MGLVDGTVSYQTEYLGESITLKFPRKFVHHRVRLYGAKAFDRLVRELCTPCTTYHELAKKLGVSHSRIGQIYQKQFAWQLGSGRKRFHACVIGRAIDRPISPAAEEALEIAGRMGLSPKKILQKKPRGKGYATYWWRVLINHQRCTVLDAPEPWFGSATGYYKVAFSLKFARKMWLIVRCDKGKKKFWYVIPPGTLKKTDVYLPRGARESDNKWAPYRDAWHLLKGVEDVANSAVCNSAKRASASV